MKSGRVFQQAVQRDPGRDGQEHDGDHQAPALGDEPGDLGFGKATGLRKFARPGVCVTGQNSITRERNPNLQPGNNGRTARRAASNHGEAAMPSRRIPAVQTSQRERGRARESGTAACSCSPR